MSDWLRIAHRGASASAPEHSRAAFERAAACKIDMIELDVHLSRDRQLVVIHDYTLERTTNGVGPVRDHTLAELQSLDSGSWFGAEFSSERILTLDEVIALIPPAVRLNVELKALDPDWDGVAQTLAALLDRTARTASTIVSSFLYGSLERLKSENSDIPLALLTHHIDFEPVWHWAERLEVAAIHPFHALVDPSLIREAHERGLQVNVWTVNDMELAKGLVAMGVDGVISDHPADLAGLS